MKYGLTIFFLVLVASVDAQKFHKCFVYQYYGTDSGSKGLVLTQTFNDRGKLVHEVSNHYINYETIGGNNTSYVRADGIYDYYYEDSLLKVKLQINPKEHHDSDKTFYYYNADRKLSRQVTRHHKPDSSEMFFDIEHNSWVVLTHDDTVLLYYDKKGNVEEKDSIRNDTTKEYFVFDEKNRLVEDRFINTHSQFESFRVKYEYREKEYRASFRYYNHLESASISEYQLDDAGRVIEERNYFPKYEDNGIPTEQYKLLNRTVTRYDKAGRIVMRMFYRGEKLTTTHVFVYE